MTYNEKRLITDYLQDNGYESDNGIKYIKRHPGSEAVVSVTILSVGCREDVASVVSKTILRFTGDIGGQVELTSSVESLSDIIAVESNMEAQKEFMRGVLNRKMHHYETGEIQGETVG